MLMMLLMFRWMTDRKVLTDHQIDMMFSICDSDGDGVLDFQEFRRMILRNRQVFTTRFTQYFDWGEKLESNILFRNPYLFPSDDF